MYISHLAVNEPADQHIRAVPDGAGQSEDFMTARMCPPAAADGAARDGAGERWYRTGRRLSTTPCVSTNATASAVVTTSHHPTSPNGRVQLRAERANCNAVLGGLCCVIAPCTSRATYLFPKMAQPSRMPMPRVSKVGIHIQLIPPMLGS